MRRTAIGPRPTAGMDAAESGEIAPSSWSGKAMIAKRIDVARRLGSLLPPPITVAWDLQSVNTAKVADGLAPVSAKRLTQMLMPRADDAAALANARKAG